MVEFQQIFKEDQLFLPDIFSNSFAAYDESSEEEKHTIIEILLKYYKNIDVKKIKILKLNGIELNSNNFYLEGPNKSYLLKKIKKINDDVILEQLTLTNWLQKKGVSVPKVLKPSNLTTELINFNGNLYYLMEFVDGEYYKGNEDSLVNSFSEIVNLYKELKLAPKKIISQKNITYPLISFYKVIREVETKKKDWKYIFGEYSDQLNYSWKKIRNTVDFLTNNEDKFLTSSFGICHIDIHPHNLLMKGDKVASILDFSSFMYGSINSSISYGLFKLARQKLVFEGGINYNISNDIDKVIKLLKKEELLSTNEDFLFFSQMEIIRRLILILDLNLNQENKEWNEILPIQINSLNESEYIFQKTDIK